jgi:hypothetical protein
MILQNADILEIATTFQGTIMIDVNVIHISKVNGTTYC